MQIPFSSPILTPNSTISISIVHADFKDRFLKAKSIASLNHPSYSGLAPRIWIYLPTTDLVKRHTQRSYYFPSQQSEEPENTSPHRSAHVHREWSASSVVLDALTCFGQFFRSQLIDCAESLNLIARSEPLQKPTCWTSTVTRLCRKSSFRHHAIWRGAQRRRGDQRYRGPHEVIRVQRRRKKAWARSWSQLPVSLPGR